MGVDTPSLPGVRQAAPRLRLYLLGAPGVQWRGQPVPVVRRQARALLFRLAAQSSFVAREQLCFLLWPDRQESEARRNLSRLLTHLRASLPALDVVIGDGDSVGLDPQVTWSDARAFKGLCAGAPMAGSTATLQQAVDLYRGRFLSGFSLDDSAEFELWITHEQQEIERLYLDALATLTERYADEGDCCRAIACAQRYLDTDELAEDIHARLMTLYVAKGDRCGALRQYERCVAILERQLGVSPLPETRAVYRAILDGRPTEAPLRSGGASQVVLDGATTPLVGRQPALAMLQEAFRHACDGRGGVVLISGEAGIGKSRLLRHFHMSVQGRGTVLAADCYPGTMMLPYQPVLQGLRAGLNLPGVLEDMPVAWLAEASRLLPELRTLLPTLPRPLPMEGDQARTRLFEALGQVLRSLVSRYPPIVLSLDDLQWADSTTLDWLAYVGSQLNHQRLLIVGTYRSDGTQEQTRIDCLRRALQQGRMLTEISLAGLSKAEVGQLVATALSDRLDPEHLAGLTRSLHQATGGNPFFLLETLQALEAGDAATQRASPAELPMPETVLEAVAIRLSQLTPVTRQVVEAAAVLTSPFALDQLCLTAGRSALEVMDSLDDLVARQVLVERAMRYVFHHELIRRAVILGMSPVRRQLLHRRAGRALEHTQPGAFAGLAHHFQQAGQADKALHYHDLAARAAEALFAWQEAEAHNQHRLNLLDQLDPMGTDPGCLTTRAQVLAKRAHMRFLQGNIAGRDSDLSTLAGLAERSGQADLQELLLSQQARYHNMEGRYAEAVTCALAGARLAEHRDCGPAHACFLTQLGFARCLLGQPLPALADLRAALAAAGPDVPPGIRGRIAHSLGYVYFHLAQFSQALAWQEEALACHQAAEDQICSARELVDIGMLHVKLGTYARAEDFVQRGLDLARAMGLQPIEARGITVLGYADLYQGCWADAAGKFQQAIDLLQPMPGGHEVGAASTGLGFALYHLGSLWAARRWLARAADMSRATGHCRGLATALIGLGLIDLEEGQPQAAQARFTEAVRVAQEGQCPEGLAFALAGLARACLRQCHEGEALQHAQEAIAVARGHELPAAEMWGHVERSSALLAEGDPQAALDEAVQALAQAPMAHEAWLPKAEAQRVLQAALASCQTHVR